MKVKRGVVVQTNFGIGKVVAVTKEWLIHLREDGSEVCVFIKDNWIGIPAEIDEIDVTEETVEFDEDRWNKDMENEKRE